MGPITRIVEEAMDRRKQPLKYKQSVKPPPRGKYWSNLWNVYSPKISRNVMLFSDLEYGYWIKIESDPDIVGFCEQPTFATGLYKGKEYKSIYDFWILKLNGTEEFWEVKYSKNLNDIDALTELKKQISIQKQWANRHGLIYSIKTDHLLNDNYVIIDNWSKILLSVTHYRKSDLKRLMVRMLVDLTIAQKLRLEDLAADFGRNEGFAAISNLLHLGLIQLTDQRLRLNWQSEVTLSKFL